MVDDSDRHFLVHWEKTQVVEYNSLDFFFFFFTHKVSSLNFGVFSVYILESNMKYLIYHIIMLKTLVFLNLK